MLERAYSTFEIKSVTDGEQRLIEGFASTPTLDRGGDVMDPAGAKFALPMPLLWQHKHDKPIGSVFSAKVTPRGIYIKARIETGVLPFIDEAWSLIKAGLVRGFSIDWKPLEMPTAVKGGGRRFSSWEWLATSTVTLPMNAETTIALIKSLDAAYLAAPGTRSQSPSLHPGAAGLRKGAAMKTISERVTALKADLQTKSARLEELINKKSDEGGLDAAETTELGSLKTAVKSMSEDLDDLVTLESAQASKAAGLTFRSPEAQRVHAPEPLPKVEVKNLPKGTGFTRYAMAVAAGKGSYSDTLAYAKRFEGESPEVVAYVKAIYGKAVEGTTVLNSPAWGSQLVYAQNLASEFIELLRPRTIMGRIPGLRNVPFNVRIASQTDGATVNWVGESGVKPVSDLGFDTLTLGQHKIAGIVVLTEELVRLSSPSAEETVRRDLVEQIARFMDQQFIDPTVTATTNRPASITNGVTAPNASGTTADDVALDINTALATFDSADVSTESVVILMTPALARGISTLRTDLGMTPVGFNVLPTGGTLFGFPVIVSSSVPSGHVILVAANEILVADDGQVSLDASNQATLDMANGSSPTFSLWQRNCIGIRAERFVTWKKRRTASVAVIDTASYGPTSPS
jgi:HK97 family phage major capsid protein